MNGSGEITRSESAKEAGVDLHDDLYDALLAFAKMTLLFHSAGPWGYEKAIEWMRLQEPILELLQTRPETDLVRGGRKDDVTTKRLCDLGRAILG